MPSMITMASTLGHLLGQPGQPLRLNQLGDRLLEALLRRQLHMAAVVEDLHAGRLQLPGQAP